jgi:hypothetical protein
MFPLVEELFEDLLAGLLCTLGKDAQLEQSGDRSSTNVDDALMLVTMPSAMK